MFFYMGKMLMFPQSLYVLENLWLSPPGKASWASRKPHRHKKSRKNVAFPARNIANSSRKSNKEIQNHEQMLLQLVFIIFYREPFPYGVKVGGTD